MKRIYPLLILSFLFSYSAFAQIFGNTTQNYISGINANQIIWLKIETGPADSGTFTHWGLYDHPTHKNTCDIKFAVYSDHATIDRPDAKLIEDYVASPTNGAYNQYLLPTALAITPSTTYWIGLRGNCTYGLGRENGVNWANPPLKYYLSYSFFSAWPTVFSSGTGSTQGTVANIAWWIVGNNMLLPVEMTSFEIENKENVAHLQWEVASELNNLGWNVQRSTNGFSFETIGFVEGQHTTDITTSYEYMDEYGKGGHIFYRLEQEDIDGTKSYSEVKTMVFSNNDISVYPTQVSTVLNISGITEATDYQIVNAQGQFLKEGSIAQGESISVHDLQSGTHFIELKGEFFTFIKM